MNGIRVDRVVLEPHAGSAHVEAGLFGRLLHLCVEVLPLAHPQVMQELGLAQPPESAGAQGFLLLLEVGPQVEPTKKVARLVGEPLVRSVRQLLLLLRPFTRVLDRQRRDDDEHLSQHSPLVGFDHHPGVTGVDRQRRDGAPVGGEPLGWPATGPAGGNLVALGGEGLQLLEQPDAVSDLATVRRVDEGEARDVAQPEGGHLEDDRGEVGAQDLGVGEGRASLEVVFGVEPDRDAVGEPPAATRALVGRGLADRLDRQTLHLRALAVTRDACGSGVDDVADAGHGQ